VTEEKYRYIFVNIQYNYHNAYKMQVKLFDRRPFNVFSLYVTKYHAMNTYPLLKRFSMKTYWGSGV